MTSAITTALTTTATPDYPAAVYDEFEAGADVRIDAAMRAEEHTADVVDSLAALIRQRPDLETTLRPALTAAIKAKAAAESAWTSARDAELAAIAARQAGPSVSAILTNGEAASYTGAVLDVVDANGTVHLLTPNDGYIVLAAGTFISVTAS